MSCKKISSEATVERSNVILQTVTMEAHLWCLVFYWHLFSVHVQQHFVYSELYYTEYMLSFWLQKDLLRRFFSLFYFSINAGSVISTLLTPVLRSKDPVWHSLIPRPRPAFCHLQYGKWGEPGIFSHVSNVRIERMVELCEGALGPEQQTGPRYYVTYHMYLACRGRMLYTPSVECVVGWTIHETQPVSFADFLHFPITSCSHEKRYQALPTFLCSKWWKPEQGLVARLNTTHAREESFVNTKLCNRSSVTSPCSLSSPTFRLHQLLWNLSVFCTGIWSSSCPNGGLNW